MVGLAVLVIGLLYGIVSLILLVKIPKQAKTWPVRIILFLFILALVLAFPVGDPILSRMAFDKYCAEHSTPIIHRTADNVDRVAFDASVANIPIKYEIHRDGGYSAKGLMFSLPMYRYIEIISSGGDVYEHVQPIDWDQKGIRLGKSLALYQLRRNRVAHNRRYSADEYQIVDASGLVMATMQIVGWHGGGFDGPLFNFTTGGYGSAKKVSPEINEVVTFLTAVLHPTHEARK